ncbi:MAG: hypothetical protein C0402_05215 [Thermodesulfovibrio sp.]|nr:hypothetical protein [Thermodesulfovibrio sp.]
MITAVIGSWMFGYMVFHMNSLNCRTNPGSRFHYYHPRNVTDRKIVEGELKTDRGDTVLTWAEIGPYIEVTLATGAAWVGFGTVKAILSICM